MINRIVCVGKNFEIGKINKEIKGVVRKWLMQKMYYLN